MERNQTSESSALSQLKTVDK